MRRLSLVSLAIIILVLVAGLFPIPVTAQIFSGVETRLTADPFDQFDPAISGSYVVYSDRRNIGDADIYLYNLNTHTETQITSGGGDQLLPDIDGTKVVYTDFGTGKTDIVLYDIATGLTTRLTNDPANQRNPAISGNRVVYEDDRNGDSEIYMMDLATMTETRLTDEPHTQRGPVICGSKVVWEDYRNGNADIFILDLGANTVTVVTDDPGQDKEPYVDGDIIAFSSTRINLGGDIYYYRISTADTVAVTSGPDLKRNPSVSGDYISYESYVAANCHILIYSIPLGVEAQAITNSADQYLNDISGNRVVYNDNRNGNLDIYLTEFSFEEPVIFPDPNLNAAIRAAIYKPTGDIYASDLVHLTGLWARDSAIADLTGLEHCTNLVFLELYNNLISDITPLSGLTKLAYLYLQNNQISDISALEGLTSLDILNLEGNQIGNITPLHDLTSLTVLNLYGNAIDDITPLSSLTNLTQLCLAANHVSDIIPLSGLTYLEMLWIWSNHISDISPLSALTSLWSLGLGDNKINDITPLSGLTSLTQLDLSYNRIADIKALVDNSDRGGLSEGDWVDVRENPLNGTSLDHYIPTLINDRLVIVLYTPGEEVTFPDPNLERAIRNELHRPSPEKIYKSDLAGLAQLHANNYGIVDLTGLEYCTNLTRLDLSYNRIAYLTPFSSLTKLTHLDLSYNVDNYWKPTIVDFSPLSALNTLTELRLRQTGISNLTPLSGMTNLNWLSIEDNKIVDLTPISGRVNLRNLYLDGNWKVNIGPLSGLTNLSHLSLERTGLTDIQALSGLTNLSLLDLRMNKIGNISTLEYLTNLSYLDLGSNLITDISALVRNSGITGQNDRVYLRGNLLDLWEGSQDLTDIRILVDRKVQVSYDTPIIVKTTCPVDLRVVDPEVLVIDKELNDIELASYIENDLDGDGDLDDMVVIRSPKEGDYRITVIPEPGASLTATYSLSVSLQETFIILANNVNLGNIPSEPYTVLWAEGGELKVAPIAQISGPDIGPVNSALSFNGSGSSDPDGATITSYNWDFGDGNTASGMTATHNYLTTGVYKVTLTVMDNDGLKSSEFKYVAVYDPSAGFVTGGGWINSPAGAYTSDSDLTGKATFGFVSKYQKGANVPTGQTQFQFHVADFNFKSTSYDWLVISGAKAKYKGTGTINGAGSYGFMLSAIDGQINGGGGVDKFRIKIWDKASGEIIYDNQIGSLDTSDTADPVTAIASGSIVIHK